MTVTVEQVEALNSKAQQLNTQRQRLEGMRDSARQAYDKALFAYKQKYGVQLDDTNLQDEYNTVSQKLQSDFENLNSQVQSIESGAYKTNVQRPSLQESSTSAQPAQAPVQTQAQPNVAQQPAPNQHFGAQPTGSAPSAPSALGGVPQSGAPVNTSPNNTGDQDTDVSEQSHTPEGWGAPKRNLNNDFSNIMGNTGGVKFGE